MIATNRWSSEGSYLHFWKRRQQRWRVKRKPLVDELSTPYIETPSAVQSQDNSQIDFPPKPVLLLRVWARWTLNQIDTYVHSLADETQELVAKLKNPMISVNKERAWEVDLLRGVTIILMVLIHALPMVALLTPYLLLPLISVRLLFYSFVAVALALFSLSLPVSEGANEATFFTKWGKRGLNTLAVLTAWFFIHGTQSLILIEMFAGIMGISLLLGYDQKIRRTGQAPTFRQQVSRALPLIVEGTILGLAFSSLGTIPGIVAGLLAMLGLSQVLAYPFLARSRWLSFTVGLAAIGFASVPLIAAFTPNLLGLLIGISIGSSPYASFLPWFGATLLGIFLGKTLYKQGERRFDLPDIAQTGPCRQLIVIGQHAHLIFLLHLPVTEFGLAGKNFYIGLLHAVKRPYPFRFI